MSRLISALAAMAVWSGAVAPASALSPRRVDGELDLRFANGAVALVADERERIGRKLQQMRSEGLCILEAAVVWAYSDQTEGPPAFLRALEKERAMYVQRLLLQQGIPAKAIYIAPRDQSTPPGLENFRKVEVALKGYWGDHGCPLSFLVVERSGAAVLLNWSHKADAYSAAWLRR